ncbi:MAG: hypothetical protein MR729_11140 [Dorea sp.]|uniref:hypothetical protein n=1 Tax=Dorea sp. YH-dor226 TaxID=3151119 RepID=UPI003051AFBD|nr:hypothetical protein [Dorea sp.]
MKNNTSKLKKPSRTEFVIIFLGGLISCALVAGLIVAHFNNKKEESEYLSEIQEEKEAKKEADKDAEKEVEKEVEEEIISNDDEPASSDLTEEENHAFDNLDVEAEVEQIRSWYYSPTESDEKFVLNNGTDGWNYSREYYFHDGVLYFAFVFNGTEEHRLYFKDGVMIRYIDENKNVYDYGNTSQFYDWESRVLQESEQFY